ncbi:MAG TPA: BON domain-containing protein [Verrucomicrobiae bacterium]|nr:BON domain-containing protein [Verrucomicrobiae bacterium]
MELKIKQRFVGAAMIAALAAGIAGCAKDPYRSSGRVMDDRMVTGRVKTALNRSPVYKFPQVDVSTYNGVVQLSGFVHREEQKAVASEMARSIDGVREVINSIAIAPQDPIYGGTVDPKTGVRGSGRNQPYRDQSSPTSQTNQYRNTNQ